MIKLPSVTIEGLEISVRKLVKAIPEVEELIEPMGPTPKPSAIDLRFWDAILLNRYKPVYAPFCDLCCACTFGKCDLTGNKRGACGMDMQTIQARWSLLQSITGYATHLSHAKELVEYLIKKYGENHPIKIGDKTPVEAPIIRVVTGIIPKRLSDLPEIVSYLESQLPDLLASIHVGQESNYLDYESKALQAGMLDLVALEVADLTQICALGFPREEVQTRLVEMGLGTIDRSKPVILCVGHNVLPGAEIIDYANEQGLNEKIEVCGTCCTAHDLARYKTAKIVGPLSRQLEFVRTGIADVLVIDEQCVRGDLFEEAAKLDIPFIATSSKIAGWLPDETHASAESIVEELVSVKNKGVLILDPKKVGEVAVRTALLIAPRRAKRNMLPTKESVIELAKKCSQCLTCVRNCPNNLPVDEALMVASHGNLEKLANLTDKCVACARCEQACPHDIPVLSMIYKAAETKLLEERYKIRAGRGAIQDLEIRMVSYSWGTGILPGVVAFVGCPNYPAGTREVYEMAEELAMRDFMICASGCSAMSIGMFKDKKGETLYERLPGDFNSRCILNVGSCVANCHILDATIRLVHIFGKRILRGNFAEIADSIMNRAGACGIAWGALTPKAHAIATGCNRFGVPVILGPHGSKHRRMYLGRKEDEKSFMLRNRRTGEEMFLGPVPEHMLYWAETKGEALVMAQKLCFRCNDTAEGRRIKLTNYIELHEKYFGKVPDDLHLWVRYKGDIPSAMEDEIMEILKKREWKPKTEWRGTDVTLLPNEKIWTFEALKRGYRWSAA